ncbi:MAG: sigma-70 family RNA polymerase sigma factor [Phycisphaerales bacterium]
MKELTRSKTANARSRASTKPARRRRRVNTKPAVRDLTREEQAGVDRILEGKYEYIDNELFALPDGEAMDQLFNKAEDIPRPDTSWYQPVMTSSTTMTHSKSMGSVLLTAAQERVIFLQYNYVRYRVCRLRDQLQESTEIDPALAREMLDWDSKALALREHIAQINLALVLAMAKRTRMSEMDFGDMVSEGNMALLRAIDKFDAARGFKFSTYGCRAILKAFSRAGVKLSRYRGLFPTDYDPSMERSDYSETRRAEHEMDCADEVKTIFERNTAELTDIEREVIEHRFHVLEGPANGSKPEPKQLTLEQVGKLIGVTKERVRQIQNKALEKMRLTLEDGYLA